MFAARLGRGVALSCSAMVVAAMVIVAAPSAGATPITHAAFTTTNTTGGDGTGHCQNGNEAVNCNIYDGKQYVWLNGGPVANDLDPGNYFFAVLSPGGQNDPNDGGANNLSDTTASPWAGGETNSDGSTVPSGDLYGNRTFTIDASHNVLYSGTHDFGLGTGADVNKIRLMPYDDTVNPGGVYIMAICGLADGYPVTPSKCKYDAFKVHEGTPGNLNGILSATKDVTPTFTRTYDWKIDKSVKETEIDQSGVNADFHYTVTATPNGSSDSGFGLSGTIYVVNDPGATGSASNIKVSDTPSFDQNGVTADCTIYDPVAGAPTEYTQGSASLAPGKELDFPYSCTLHNADSTTSGTNTAEVDWDNPQGATPANDSTVSPPAPFDFSTATPTDEVNKCITVDDTLGPNGSGATLGTACFADGVQDFKYTYTATGTAGTCTTIDNTATIEETSQSANAEAKLCVGADLTVKKDANPSFTRTYNWNISKSVDKTKVEQFGGTAKFTYTVVVSQTGVSDSSIQATGSITVSNPNDWESVTLTGVTDSVDNGGTCSINAADAAKTTATLAPKGQSGDSVTLGYTCTYSSVPADGTNTATATWSKTAAFTPDDSANGTADVKFGAPTSTVHKSITPTDTFNGGSGVKLCTLAGTLNCTLTATDSAPFTTATYVYSRTIAVPANGCLSYTNTADDTVGQTADATVTVCGPAKTGALTMGFWQNKNGQGIITGGSSTNNVCNSGTWLRQFAPFQDLSATAKCSDVAMYVYNVVKAANAGGTSMNPMLKAQMLATALDVYFSNPALGGNKISAPAPIGGVAIDLTTICKMIDGSGGGSCSGSFENVSSAFGGATSLTVLQMLTYAASQSNAGGSVWYGQVKATQGLAKDAFDAINNGVAFGA